MSSWYSENYDGVEQAAKDKEERKSRQVRRLWVKPHTSAPVIFLDDRAFSFWEHQLYMNGSWDNHFTCLGKANGCPLCLSGKNPSRVTAFSIVDGSSWTDKKGNIHVNEKKLYVVKEDIALSLKAKHQRWGGLKGKKVIVSRKGKEDHASGSDFELAMENGQIVVPDLSKFKDIEPFDYLKIFEPMSAVALREALSVAQISQRSGEEVSTGEKHGGNEQPAQQGGAADPGVDIPF